MYTILKKELLNSNEIYLMEIHAPWIALGGQPGQFVIVIPHDKGERVPLTICDIHPERESIDIVYQVVGDSTRRLSLMAEGERLYSIVGPLGCRSELLAIPEEERPTALLAQAPTISHLYPAAEFKEREVYDMFGIDFKGHPDQRRIFLDDDFVGYPLRKDFTHPEMIRRPV